MGNVANLQPQKSGEPSKNPNGRPKGSRNRSTILKKWLSVKTLIKHPITKEDIKVTVEDEVVLSLIKEARKGDVRAIREILDTMYGKITEKTELTGADGAPIKHNVIGEVSFLINEIYSDDSESGTD
jgi:hypothetical protein